MRTWGTENVYPKDLISFEKRIDDNRDYFLEQEESLRVFTSDDWIIPGSKELESPKVNTISQISAPIEIDGVKMAYLKNSGSRFSYQGNVIKFSASEENERRRTDERDEPSSTSYPMSGDEASGNFFGMDDVETYSNYSGANVIIMAYYLTSPIQQITVNAGYKITNLTTSAVKTGTIAQGDSIANPNSYVWLALNCGTGNLKFELTSGSVPRTGYVWPVVYIRRCKYPLQSGNPIKVYNSTYTATENRVITYADYLARRTL